MQDTELEFWLRLKNIENLDWTKHIFSLLLRILVWSDLVQCLDQVFAIFWRVKISEESQGLNPQVSRHTRIKSGLVLVLDADFKNHIFIILLDVIIKQLLLETQ